MEIILNKRLFLTKFLVPVSKFTDQTIININNDNIDCLSYTTGDKQTIFLYTKLLYKTNSKDVVDLKLNIGSIKKLINALNLIPTEIICITVDKNSISYKSDENSFRFHLKEDGIIDKSSINFEKIDKTEFQTEIILTQERLFGITKAGGYISDTNKVYLSIKDNKVYCELTDKTIANVDTTSMVLSDSFTSTVTITEDIIMKADIFKLISGIKFTECLLKINNKGVIMFDIKDEDSVIKYVTTSMVK